MKTLIVDDDPGILDLLAQILQLLGQTVMTCTNGMEAWQVLQQVDFPLIILDWMLPEIDGLELCRRIRTLPRGKQSHILMVTARLDRAAMQQALAAGADDYLTKPFDVEVLQVRLSIAERYIASLAERRQVEEALQESNDRYAVVLSALDEGVILQYRDGRIGACNASAERILGVSVEQMMGRTPMDSAWATIHEDGTPWLAHAQPAMVSLSTARPCSNVVQGVRKPDGTITWISINARPLLHQDEELPYAVVTSFTDVTERKQAEQSLLHQALHDALTDLPNRIMLRDRVGQMVLAAQRTGTQGALLVMDLDHFKEINDTLGHQVGDALLQQIGPRLHSVLRAVDTVGRLGGDEFAILLPLVAGGEGALLTAGRILAALATPFYLAEQNLSISASIGIALSPGHGEDMDTLLRHADIAMYVAKRGRIGMSVYAPAQDHHTTQRLLLMSQLRSALEHDELQLYYQPKIALASGHVVGVEALLRWPHPEHGMVPPDTFIPLAEYTGVIRPVGIWTLRKALGQMQLWRAQGHALPVAVNLSVRHLEDAQLLEQIAALLVAYGTMGDQLTIEITESVLMANLDGTLPLLTGLHALGVRLSIDDFGTGHSSLAYLMRLPAAELKIDRSFVRDIQTSDNARIIVRSIISLAQTLGLRVVAEGIEDQETWDIFHALGCDVAQGYYVSRPLPVQELEQWLSSA